ncbi:MAG TPA: STN domain-containing protein [Chthonomonadaceae bacterium]|nr:STN domain-containing protein [Chthonomonadaceae bacterium]
MRMRNGAITLAALALTAIGFAAAPTRAAAQAPGQKPGSSSDDQLNRPINLDVRSGNLYYALTLLFDQLKIGNYTLPDQLKQIEVSAHFSNLPIRTALETLLKNSGYTFRVDGGVYSVVPKIEVPPDNPLPPEPANNEPTIKSKRIYRLAGNQIIYNAVDIVTRLGGRVLPPSVGSTGGQAGNGGQLGGIGGGLGGIGGGSGLGGGLGGFGGMGGLGGGLGGLGGGLGGFGSGGGLYGGGGYYGGGNNYGNSGGGTHR